VFQVNSDGTLVSLGAPVSTPANPTGMATAANTLLVSAQQTVNGVINGTLSLYAIKSGALSFSSSTAYRGIRNGPLM